MFQGIDELEGANGVGARTEEILARNAAGTKPRKAGERSQSVSRGMVGGAAGREGSANKSPLPSRAHQSFQSAYASVISQTSLKDLVLYALC